MDPRAAAFLRAADDNPAAALDLMRQHDAEESLLGFIRYVWDAVNPGAGDEFVSGWALEAICEHLQAVSDGEIKKLIINCPPGLGKSTLTTQAWPTFEWLTRPHLHYATVCYDQPLAKEHHRKSRLIMASERFQEAFGDRFKLDRVTEADFTNDRTGRRYAVGIDGSITGRHFHRIIVDDPITPAAAESEKKREGMLRYAMETIPSRVKKGSAAVVVVMQRLHEADMTGHLIAADLGFEKLVLPMRFERDHRCTTSIGFRDPREEEGELLFPELQSEEHVALMEKQFRYEGGEFAVAAQLQQRPTSRQGGIFDTDKIEVIEESQVPVEGRPVRGWDLAGSTKRRSPFTAGVLMKRVNNTTYILDVVRFKAEADEVRWKFRDVAEADPENAIQDVPQDPGSSGKAVARDLVAAAPSCAVFYSTEAGTKENRALPLAAQVGGGLVKIVKGDWNRQFLAEMAQFPGGVFKDQVDAASRAYARIMPKRRQRGFGAPQLIKRTI